MDLESYGFEKSVIDQIKENAIITVKSMFDTPEKLEKLDIFLEKEKKNFKKQEKCLNDLVIEAGKELKASMQEISLAFSEIKCLKENIDEMHSLTLEYKKRERNLQKLISLSHEASSTTQTLNLLRHIINMNDTLESTKSLMKENQLLRVHKNLRDLEDVRDKILSKHFDTSSQKTISKSVEKNLLVKNFEPIRHLSEELLQSVKSIVKNCLEYYEKDPTMLVSALRILEREEKVDQYWQTETHMSSRAKYKPADRPKQWANCIDGFLTDYVHERFNNVERENTQDGNIAFSNYIFRVRDAVLEDVKKFQLCGQRCFPPSYAISSRISRIFHEQISTLLAKAIAGWKGSPSEGDVVAILVFYKEYFSAELFGSSDLNPDICKTLRNCKPLIVPETLQRLEQLYLSAVFDALHEKVKRVISLENRSLEADKEPPLINNLYISFTTNFYNDFVGYKISYAKLLSSSTFEGVFKHCFVAFEQLITQYEQLFENYVNNHFCFDKQAKSNITTFANLFRTGDVGVEEQPRKYERFAENCICIANNCHLISKCAVQMNEEISSIIASTQNESDVKFSSHALTEEFSNRVVNITTLITDLIEKCNLSLVNDFIFDINDSFELLFGPKWKAIPEAWSSGFQDSISGFYEVVVHVEPSFVQSLHVILDKSLARKYLYRFLSHKSKYSPEQLESLGAHVSNDANFLTDLFAQKREIPPEETYCYGLLSCANVFKNVHQDAALIDLAKMYKTYSDFTREHGFALISKRADLSRDKINEVSAMNNIKSKKGNSLTDEHLENLMRAAVTEYQPQMKQVAAIES